MTPVVRLLEEVQVLLADGPAALGPARQRALLAILLLTPGRPVQTDDLVHRVWGDEPPPGARQTLRAYVCRLRQCLGGADGPVSIHRRSGGYAAQVEAGALDLSIFRNLVARARAGEDGSVQGPLEAYEQALGVWRGSPLSGVASPWLDTQRDALRLERHGVELDRNDLALATGRATQILADLSALAREEPFDERVAGQLMTALHATGRTAQALAHYRQVRRHLREELGTEPGMALRAAHRRVLDGEPPAGEADQSAARSGWGGSRTAPPSAGSGRAPVRQPETPRQLPPAPAGFVGRQEQWEAIEMALGPRTDPGPRTAVLSGPGGVGKTTLAIHWATRRADRFPDGQLFLDLRGFDPDRAPMPVETALHCLLLGLGADPRAMPVEPEALAGLYRSLAGDRKILLVADNARSVEHVRPLLPPGAGSAMLVTSRCRLAGLVALDRAHPVAVPAMSRREAHSLLVARLGPTRAQAQPAAVDTIVERCGGLALALTIVGARAALHPDVPLERLAAELADDDARLDGLSTGEQGGDLPATLAATVAALPPPGADAFGRLGLSLASSLCLSDVAVLADLGRDGAAAVVRTLTAYHLLEPDGRGRHRMHDLVRLYAASLGRAEPGAGSAQLRLLERYRDAPDLVAGDVAGVVAGIDLAADRGLDELTCDLAPAVEELLAAWGCWRQLVRIHTHGVEAATRLQDPHRLAASRLGLGRALVGMNDFAAAAEPLGRARQAAERDGDVALRATAHRAWARWAARQGRHAEALAQDAASLPLHRRAGSRSGEATALNAIGWHEAHLGRPGHALAHCRRALAVFEELDDPAGRMLTLDSIALALDLMGDHAAAQEHYLRALDLADAVGNVVHTGETLQRLADSYRRTGDVVLARRARQDSRAVLRSAGVLEPTGAGVRPRPSAPIEDGLARPVLDEGRHPDLLVAGREQ